MTEQFAAAPINPIVSIQPLATSSPGRDATSVPPQLAKLAPGTLLEGFVVNRDAQNNPILRTTLGDVQLKSDVFVKTGSELVIRVDTTQESRARIITIDGVTPQDYAARNSRGLTQDTIAPSQLLSRTPGAAPGVVTPAQPSTQPLLQGVVLNQSPPSANSPFITAFPNAALTVPPPLLKLQAGAMLKVSVLSLQLPQHLLTRQASPAAALPGQTPPSAPGAAGANHATTSASASATPGAAVPSPAPGAPSSTLQSAEMANAQTARIAQGQPSAAMPANVSALRPLPYAATPMSASATNVPAASHFVAATHSAPPVPASSPVSPGGSSANNPPPSPVSAAGLPALVIGHERDGANIVQTGFGTLKLYTTAPLPLQSQVSLQVEPGTPRPAPLPGEAEATTDSDSPLSVFSRRWPGLEELVRLVHSDDAALGRELLQSLPQMGPKFTSSLLFFLAAVKGGELRQWLGGRTTERLDARFPEATARLRGDFMQMQQLFVNSPIDQWAGTMLPLLHGNQLDYARLYVRDESGGDGGEKASGRGQGQRFIVELELSHLGDMQFDGFVRDRNAAKQFDLIIRTARALPNEVSAEIRTRFDDAMGATGYTGYLAYQHGAQHFVRPLATMHKPNAPDAEHPLLA